MTESTSPRKDAMHPPHQPVPLDPVPTEIVAEWPPQTFVENLAPVGDGTWVVTIHSHNRVDRVHPDGGREVLAELPDSPSGIVTANGRALVLVGTLGSAGWRLLDVSCSGDSPAVSQVCRLPELVYGNGMTWAGNRLLIADSLQGQIHVADPAARASSAWLGHELLTKTMQDSQVPGVNGLAVHNGWVYLSNTERGLVLRSPLASTNPPAELEVVADRLTADDFDVDSKGRLYLATHTYNSVLRLDPDGHREDIAGVDQGLAGSTSVAIDPHQAGQLYATTNGGLFSPPGGQLEPARFVRLTP